MKLVYELIEIRAGGEWVGIRTVTFENGPHRVSLPFDDWVEAGKPLTVEVLLGDGEA